MITESGVCERRSLIFKKGEEIVETTTNWARENEIPGAWIHGLGAIKNIELGYYDLEKKDYLRKEFKEDFELISLNGNVSLKDGDYFTHVHCSISDQSFQVFGGHLFRAEVAVTVEVSLSVFGKMPTREMDESLGLAVICGFKG